MGAWRRLGKAAAWAAILCCATRSGASTVVEPIARLSFEGAYDSNSLYDGKGDDRTAKISPEVGLRVRDPQWDLRAAYGGDWIYYARLKPDTIWNHRGAMALSARPTERTTVEGRLHAQYAFDPVGLAQAGVFRTGQQSALIASARARAEWRTERRIDLAALLIADTVVFEDRSGGAMYEPGVEALWRYSPRLSLGGAAGVGVFHTLDPAGNSVATAELLRGRARYRISRRFTLDASAGPAFWSGETTALVPEARAELLGTTPRWDVRLTAAHALGIGYTARPGLVNSLEFGAERRLQRRRYFLRADGGVWESGIAPTGAEAVTGYAFSGEAGAVVAAHMRISVVATHFGRMDDPSPEFHRTTVGLRLGWELPVR